MSRLTGVAFLLGAAVVGITLGWFIAEGGRAVFASPAPVPHVQSDCRAACTLEGMALAGVELTPGAPGLSPSPRCLCAPVSLPGGDL